MTVHSLRKTAAAIAVLATVVPAAAAQADWSPTSGPHQFDVQAHRGGLGLVTESTLQSFANGLEVGASTLELDVQITEDLQAVVTHDRQVQASKCRDTQPAFPGDPEYPYVGDFIRNLTLAQVQTLRCDKPLASFPEQRVVPDARIPKLSQVFALVNCLPDVRQASRAERSSLEPVVNECGDQQNPAGDGAIAGAASTRYSREAATSVVALPAPAMGCARSCLPG